MELEVPFEVCKGFMAVWRPAWILCRGRGGPLCGCMGVVWTAGSVEVLCEMFEVCKGYGGVAVCMGTVWVWGVHVCVVVWVLYGLWGLWKCCVKCVEFALWGCGELCGC